MKIHILFFILILSASCQKVLDKKNLGAITSTLVYNDYKLATSYMDYIAAQSLPNWPIDEDKYCDEGSPFKVTSVGYGQATKASEISAVNWATAYSTIRSINVFLEEMKSSPIDLIQKTGLLGQAYFWRAYIYFNLVKIYGGVPYLRKAQKVEDSLFVARDKTSDCFTLMIEDLDSAILMLPEKFSTSEAGKINRATAYAFKGRVFLYRASPQFNPDDRQELWREAFDANKEAYDWLVSKGYGLYSNFGGLWFTELNNEVIFVTRYNNPEKISGRAKACRPFSEVTAAGTANFFIRPTKEIVDAFPMKDGKPITNNPNYNLNTYWNNRDPRFNATIVYNGALWELSGKTGRIQWTYVGSVPDGYLQPSGTTTGYFTCKAVPNAITAPLAFQDGTDWIELRFAEVVLNYAETANKVAGQQSIAYDMLKAIRKRAGIDAGTDQMYGLKATMSTDEMVDAIMLERQIEFAFEGKRFWDLRRMRWLQRLNGTVRHGLSSTPINKNDLTKGFTMLIFDVDKTLKLNYPLNYYFFPIDQVEIQNNPKLKQTDGWYEGGFNPLE